MGGESARLKEVAPAGTAGILPAQPSRVLTNRGAGGTLAVPAGAKFLTQSQVKLRDMSNVWHSRGYIPHWEAGEIPQAITFRLGDSLPTTVLESLEAEFRYLPDDMANTRRRKRIEAALDQGHGIAHLADARVAAIVENAFLYFDANRYRLHAWTIMPNHVHVIATPLVNNTLSDIVHSWKSFTAKAANRVLDRTGVFWSREYFDRAIRDEVHFATAIAYVDMNPVKAKLCTSPEEWRFSSARRRWDRRHLAGNFCER